MSEQPLHLVTHTQTKDVLLTPELQSVLPHAENAFAHADAKFNADRRGYLGRLEESQFMTKTKEGPEVACSLIMNEGQSTDELLILFAPFSDRNPKTSAETMYRYITGDPDVSRTQAKPHTWSQITKSAVTSDVLEALGHGMPVLTIFTPIPLGAYTRNERALFKNGDFTSAGRLAMEAVQGAVEQAQLRVHGLHSTEQFTKLHLSGASLGASNAIGAAVRLMEHDFDVQSVTAQELVMSPHNLPDLARRFTAGGLVGEVSTEAFPRSARVLAEAALRQAIDYKGSEPIGMNLRMAQGASKLAFMRGLTRSAPTTAALEHLQENNIPTLVATADNSGMSDKTRSLIPIGTPQVHIAAEKGERLGHIVDEHVTASALVTLLGVTRAKRKRD